MTNTMCSVSMIHIVSMNWSTKGPTNGPLARDKSITAERIWYYLLPQWFTDFWHIKREDNYNIHIKTVPSEKLSLGWIDIRRNKVALHNYKEWFVTTTILENKEISGIIRCMFDALRSTADDYQGEFLLV